MDHSRAPALHRDEDDDTLLSATSPSTGFFELVGRLIRALDQFPTPEAFDAMMGELEGTLANGPGAPSALPDAQPPVQLDELLLEKLFHRWRHKE